MKYDEFSVGETFYTEKVLLTKDEIMRFAKEYDPQYFHMNETAAIESPYGSMIASGFHTLAVIWNKWIQLDVLGPDCLGGIGMEIKWTAPVRPNDEIMGAFTVIEKKKTSSGERGVLTIEINITNQEDNEVLMGQTNVLVKA